MPTRNVWYLREGTRYETSRFRDQHGAFYTNVLLENGLLAATESDLRPWYVGVVTVGPRTYCFLPKYVPAADEVSRTERMRRVVQVLRRYGAKETPPDARLAHLSTDILDPAVSDLSVAAFLIQDYLDYGLYRRFTERTGWNIPKPIDWHTTIRAATAFVTEQGPVYLDTAHRVTQTDAADELTRAHRAAVRESFEQFSALLGYSNLNDMDLELSGGGILDAPNRVAHLAENELRVVYSDREILLMKALVHWFGDRQSGRHERITKFGTSNYEHVWEKVCGQLTGNEANRWREALPGARYRISETGQVAYTDRPIPDILRLLREPDRMLVWDAKYYDLHYASTPRGTPGLPDVMKQCGYAQIVSTLEEIEEGVPISNAFLLPSYDVKEMKSVGTADLPGMPGGPIGLVMVNPDYAYELYLATNGVDEADLHAIATSWPDAKID